MSGERRVTVNIDRAEYQRLHTSEHQLRAMRQDLPELLKNAQRQAKTDLQRRLKPLEDRQQRFNQAVNQLHEDVRDFERATAEQLGRQHREFHQSVQQVRGEVHDLARQTAQQFAQQREEFNHKLQQQRRQLEQKIQSVEGRVGDIEKREQHRQHMAQAWLGAAQLAHDQINANPRHQQFVPGKLQEQTQAIRLAQGNLDQGASEAALAQAQEAAHRLSNLLLELQQKEEEWQLWRSAAQGSAHTILALAERNRKAVAFDTEGKELDEPVDVDYWTKGKLKNCEQEITAIIQQVENEQTPLSTEDLRQLAEQRLPQLDQRLDDIVLEARAELLGSQVRINIADLVVQALEEQGFEIDGGIYEGKDTRSGFVAKVTHLDGGEVSVCVNPVDGQPGRNTLSINSYDVAHLNPDELENRQEEIYQVLREQGLDIADSVCLPQPDPALRDLQAVEELPVSAPATAPTRATKQALAERPRETVSRPTT